MEDQPTLIGNKINRSTRWRDDINQNMNVGNDDNPDINGVMTS
jgi:hypothetical protein